jgi:predicted nuclease of predicted toxin-antitoxin system
MRLRLFASAKFLVDECLRALVAELLRDAGHEAVRAGDVGLLGKPDVEVIAPRRRAGSGRRFR